MLDSGLTVSLSSLPQGLVDLTVTNGTTLVLGGSSANLGSGSVTVTYGSIENGSITAASFTLDDADIDANLTGSSLTVSDLVSLGGTDSFSGPVTIETANDELDIDRALYVQRWDWRLRRTGIQYFQHPDLCRLYLRRWHAKHGRHRHRYPYG